MAAEPELKIPVLTEEIGKNAESRDRRIQEDAEALIAELQTQIAASTFNLADDILRKAFAEMEASVFEEISGRLRRELPEMIDILLRERLGDEKDF